ncbi:protein of unknown function DUF1236 [Rhizobium sp. CF080]|uniref:DUF1236 domain-containing protein n=1 Tax=Rhizobium sp. (strain CF080) TaxID=1144310 RepID=UPI00027177CD|nr:DUF1236 domain-containing protein [Rhizobium sp. CF080]EUB95014.1 protein of unknown function DUF1236 [Rhizobium sp. CF080]
MRKTLLAASAVLIALSGAAYAQTTIVTQDPVTTNSTVVLPGEVRTYVMQQSVPSVSYQGDIAVGTALPDTVEVHTVDGYNDYAYTVVNERRVIVNPQTRTVIQVLE